MFIINDNQLTEFAKYLRESQKVVFFGGAGVSTESGLPDYRSKNGVYTSMENDGDDPKKVMHIKYIMNHPREFFRRLKSNKEVLPNASHFALVELEQMGKDVTVITQNVDGLHQKAGSLAVYELHGSPRKWFCMSCGDEVKEEDVIWEDELPSCQVCSGLMRPGVTYFGEVPNRQIIEESREMIKQADVLIIAGTSLTVSPAKRLIQAFDGKHVIVINKEELDTKKLKVDLTFDGSIGEVLATVVERLKEMSE